MSNAQDCYMNQNPISNKELAREIANALHFLGDAVGHIKNAETAEDHKPALVSFIHARTFIEVVRNYNSLGGNTNLKLFDAIHHIDNAYMFTKLVASGTAMDPDEYSSQCMAMLEALNKAIQAVGKIKGQIVEQAAYDRLKK